MYSVLNLHCGLQSTWFPWMFSMGGLVLNNDLLFKCVFFKKDHFSHRGDLVLLLGFLYVCHIENVAQDWWCVLEEEGKESSRWLMRVADVHSVLRPAPVLHLCVCEVDGRPWLTSVAATLLKAVLPLREEEAPVDMGCVWLMQAQHGCRFFFPRGRRKRNGD